MSRQLFSLILVLQCAAAPEGQLCTEAAEPLWHQLVPRKRVQSDPEGDYTLAKENGPWLILAASFSGPQAEKQARDLVLELRRQFNLTAYYYGMTFQLEDANPGRGLDSYGGRIKRRYQRGDRVREHAVLVGEFPTIDDPAAQKMLKQIKRLSPNALNPAAGEPTAQSLATVREFHEFLRDKIGSSTKKGPMGHAFLSSNPLLPKEYFISQGIDNAVARWNEPVEYSLLKCPGNYSVRVATFKGRSALKAAKVNRNQAEEKVSNALHIAAGNAHLLTVALREKGWEAYEFHDRHESYVTIGSFRDGNTAPNGSIILADRDAQVIINTFGGTTPNNIFNRPALQDNFLEQQQKQRFNELFSSTAGQVAQGFHPKQFVGMPLDIHPQPVKVPRHSVSTAYARN